MPKLSYSTFLFRWYFGQQVTFSPFFTTHTGSVSLWFDHACGSKVAWCGCSPGWSCVFTGIRSLGFIVSFEGFWFFILVKLNLEKSFESGWRTCFWQIWLLNIRPWSVTTCFRSIPASLSSPGSKATWLLVIPESIWPRYLLLKLFWPLTIWQQSSP